MSTKLFPMIFKSIILVHYLENKIGAFPNFDTYQDEICWRKPGRENSNRYFYWKRENWENHEHFY